MARVSTKGVERDDQLPRRIYGALLPTPTTNPDKRSQEAVEAYEAQGKTASSTTLRAVHELSATCVVGSAAPTGGMRLTPEFLCWLMGYPPGWLKPLRDALGTASSRRRRSAS
jgi:hypothetical protein